MEPIQEKLNSIYQQANTALASSTHFLFQVTDHPESTFKVIHWQGNEGISTSYRYTLSLAANGAVDDSKILGQPATLSIDRDGEMRLIHGYVSEIHRIGELVSDHAEEYQLELASPLAKLHLTRQSRVFLNLDLKSLIEQVLLTAGFTADSFKIDLQTTYPVREYIAQYNETDFNFFSRLLEHAGVFYRFEQQEKQALLVILDDSAQLPAMPGTATLSYVPVSGQMNGEETVQLLQRQMFYLPESVKRKDHNYRTPETTLLSQASTTSKIPAAGTDYIYGERSVTLEEAEQLARRRQQMYDCLRDNYIAETNCRGMSAGTTLTVSDNPQDNYNGDYLVLSVIHKGDQSNAFAFGGGHEQAATGKTYSNEAILIKKDTPYRPPVDRKRIPLVLGTLTAKIETTGGDYAYLDDQGRYRLKPLFDVASTKAGEASHPVRMMQPSAGANYGMHFPLHAGTEVIIACMNGDPDRPIILGAMTNPATTSPVTSANASHHTVRTFAGNELLMDDLADSEKINLHTKDQKNILSLDANSDGHKLALRTEEGLAEFYAKKIMRFESGDSYSVITGNDQTITVENKHSLQTNKKDIAFNAGTDIALTAKDNIKLSAQDKDLSLTSGQDLIIESGKDMSVRVSVGDSSYTIEQGSVSIDAANAITLLSESGPISIEQGGGSVEISDGKLSIRGATVAIEGSSVAIAGQMAEMMGGGGSGAKAASKAAPVAAATEQSTHDIHFLVQDEITGKPLANIPYKITLGNGKSVEGKTDESGLTEKISDNSATIATLEAPYYGNSTSSTNTSS
ncbi:MAG: type VI secretion system tip protein TssI/VgrG [Sideroxyarcus sp.]|nr:type VI secretion system tip protein TssI/VgrG [Sideroxyarcus sp.]